MTAARTMTLFGLDFSCRDIVLTGRLLILTMALLEMSFQVQYRKTVNPFSIVNKPMERQSYNGGQLFLLEANILL